MKKIILLILLSFLTFNSCKKENNPVTPEEDIIVANEGTKVLTEGQTIQLDTTNLRQDSLYFNGDVTDLKADDIIISEVGDGILRKVKSIQKVGSQSLVTTDTTSLADAFQQLTFEDSIDLSEDDVESVEYDIPGVKLLKTNNRTGLSFGIEDCVLYDHDGNPSTNNDQIKGSGTFTLSLKPIFKCKIDHGLKYFKAAIKPTGAIEIEAKSDVEIFSFNKSIKVATLKMKKMTIWVGWVPIVIKTSIPIYLGVEGDASVGIKVSIKDEASFTFGGEYKDNSFHFIADAGNKFTFNPPTIYGAASLKFYLEPHINYNVYGAGGPELKFRIFLSGEGEITGSNLSADIYAGMDAKVGMILNIFGKKLSKYSDPLFVIKLLLKHWEVPLGGGTKPTVTTDQFYPDGPDVYGGGEVTDEGSTPVTIRGVCWSTSQNPTISDNKTNNGSGIGHFSSVIHGVSSATTYYVRAYATNIAGTGYGNEVSFTTWGGNITPTVTTDQITVYTSTEANGGGNVTDEGSAPVTARGICWNTSQNPTIFDNKTNDGSGTGPFQSIMQGLTPSTTYYVRAYATNSAGTGYGNQVYFTTQQGSGFTCGSSQVQYEGKIYNTVLIGNQCWLKENLDVGTRINGSQDQTNNGIIEKYCYNDDPNNCTTYGGLYQWDEIMQYTTLEGTQGICPEGWHIPTYVDWDLLTDFLGGQEVAGGKMKEVGTLHWLTPNTGATNESGFTALPGGAHDDNGFYHMGLYCRIWSSYQLTESEAGERYINSTGISCYQWITPKIQSLSVRCIKD